MKGLKDILGIKYDLGQAPMLGVATPEMVAAIANQGGLGTLPLGGLPPAVCDKLLTKTKELTDKPFAINIFLHPIIKENKEDIASMQTTLKTICKDNNIPYEEIPHFIQPTYHPILEVVLKHNIKIITFTFGCFTKEEIELLHKQHIFLIGTATTVEEAKYLQDHKIDAIVLQGIEAGGHRGSFLSDNIEDNLPLNQLFDCVRKEGVNIPLIVTGGLFTGKQAKDYFNRGASFATFGSLFITATESNAMEYQKDLLSKGTAVETKFTKAFSGKWARGIINDFMTQVDNSKSPIPDFPFQNILTQNIRFFAKQKNLYNFNSLWCGINAHHATRKDTKDIFNKLITEFYEQ
ncbi:MULTISPECIES: NAD(P)H-dependent flavin oxidoreductase [Myroides]|uniref:NAD(P)H-dependent flavin oxidoreductase n=1 Tax=Myroides TaxID=76831 RepID=UPI00132982FB|nr:MULTISPECIES: nitronate monooxygenase [Myroides]MVX34943.1 nitronate monooxygenase [Myroides sp. LoEW2-1]UVD79536.1 nitronate monooxygenase [Myroides albus]